MISMFVDSFMKNKDDLRMTFAKSPPSIHQAFEYADIVRMTVSILGDGMSGANVTEIEPKMYHGAILYIISSNDYTNRFWSTHVSYGSCAVCDTLEGIQYESSDTLTTQQLDDYMTMCLHIVQSIKVVELQEAEDNEL